MSLDSTNPNKPIPQGAINRKLNSRINIENTKSLYRLNDNFRSMRFSYNTNFIYLSDK